MNKISKLLVLMAILFAGSNYLFSMGWLRSWWSGEDSGPVQVQKPVEDEDELSRAIEASLREQTAPAEVQQGDVEADLQLKQGIERSFAEIYPMKLWRDLGEAGDVFAKIELCDQMNKEAVFVNESGIENIIQVPCLYQAYPGLPENYCGYYAAYFAMRMFRWLDGRIDLDSLNNRGAFGNQLKLWLEFVAGFGEEAAMLRADSIRGMLGQAMGERDGEKILVEGYDFERKDLSKLESKISRAIANFNLSENHENLCLIYNTSAAGSHWIAILATKDGRLIIADPLATNRTGFDYIIDLYNAIFGRR